MSINQGQAPADPQQPYSQQPYGQSYPQQSYPQQPYGQPPAPGYGYMPPAEPPKKNTVAIWAIVLAFLAPGIGFILSIIALVQSGKRGRRGLSIAALVISLLISSGISFAVYEALKNTNIATVADPGCTTAKSAILDNSDAVNNDATIKQGLQATVTGLNNAVAKAQHDNVKQAVTALRDDYSELLNDVNTTTQPAAGLQTKLTNDANAVDALCTVGGTAGS
jgi:hypothetical protein